MSPYDAKTTAALSLATRDPTYRETVRHLDGTQPADARTQQGKIALNEATQRVLKHRRESGNPDLFDELAATWNGTAEQLAAAVRDLTADG